MKEIKPQTIIDSHGGGRQGVLPGWEDEVAELLTRQKEDLLSQFFTNVGGDVHVIRGSMPPVLAAALITRFSRAQETNITEIFWEEFIENPEIGISLIAEQMGADGGLEGVLAEERASKIIRRVLEKFGDDSVREQASGYVIIQDSSVLFSLLAFRHPLITGIEASTRYINWDEKDENGHYRYIVPEAIKGTKHEQQYIEAMDNLFEVYGELLGPVRDYVIANNPKPDGMKDSVYETAVRGRVLDNLRKLLPLGIKTNFGLHARYRSLTELIMDLKASGLEEARKFAEKMTEELLKVNPEFVSVVESEHADAWVKFKRGVNRALRKFSIEDVSDKDLSMGVQVRVLNKDPLMDVVIGAISSLRPGLKEEELKRIASEKINDGSYKDLFREIGEARTNRRHKLPEFFQRLSLAISIDGTSFGSAKDFNRHRDNLDKTDFDWSGRRGIYVPEDIEAIGGEIKDKYLSAQERALKVSQEMAEDFPQEARMLFTHGTKTSMELVVGLGQAYWIAELRSIASGDPEYRRFAQEIHRQLEAQLPDIVPLLGNFVDTHDYQVGRIKEAVTADLKGTSAAG